MYTCPPFGRTLASKDIQGILEVVDSSFQVLRPVAPDAIPVGQCQTVLDSRPEFWEIAASCGLQRLTKAADGFLEVLRPVASETLPVREPKVVLSTCPILGRLLACVDF